MILGHQKQWNFLKKATEAERISHAYLFTGQEKIGKKKVALEWASLLFNQNILKKYNPDLLLVEPDTQAKRSGEDERSSSPGKEIKISQIRELIRKLSLASVAPIKIAIINKAHLMNQEAQNALLKTLEEPKGKTLLILITEFSEVLFPTILSRVQVVKFYPVKEQEMIEYLRKQGIDNTKSKEIVKFSNRKPGLAIDFLLNPDKLEEEKKIVEELINISKANLSLRFQYVKKITENASRARERHSVEGEYEVFLAQEDIGGILDIWLKYFRDTDINKFKNIIKQIQNVSFLLSSTNINPKLALEVLMLKL